MDFEDSKY